MKNLSLTFICLILFSSVFSQNAEEILEKYSQRYPSKRYVVLDRIEKVSVDIVDGKIEIIEDHYESNLFLDNEAGYLSEDKISFSSFDKIIDIEAKTLVPKKKRFKTQKVKDFKIQDEFSRGIFHDDLKSMSFKYPSLQKGAITNINYKKKVTEPRFLSGFYFISGYPVVNQEFILEVHEDIEIELKSFNTEGIALNIKENKKGNKKIYSWKVKDLNGFEIEERAPKLSYYAPHLVPYIKSYTVNGKKEKVLSEAKDLFNWYNSLIKDVNQNTADEGLEELVLDITKDAQNDLDKVKRIYYWTQENIKYIAFEEGMDGFIPRNTEQVVDQKYGDCKDMSACMSKLLSYADVPVSICWVGTDDIPYSYSELPTPAVDNHMIAAYKHNDEYYFLDATSEYNPFGFPSQFIQGKQAMVRVEDDDFELVKIPVVDAIKNQKKDEINIRIEGDKLVGNSEISLAGYRKSYLNYNIGGLTKDDQFKFFSDYLKKGSNKFILEKLDLKNEFNKDKDTRITFSFNLDDYLFRNKNEIYIDLSFYNWTTGLKVKDDRTIPMKRRFKSSDKTECHLTIPDGYQVSFIPKDVNLKNKKFSYRSSYKVVGNEVVFTEELIHNYILLEKEDFEQWNKFIEAVEESINETIILKKI